MELLIGSQNFGYSTPESDKDWMQFVYPTWSDILNNNMTSKENILSDNTHVKIYDIRLINKIIWDAHISSLQFMFSTEYHDCDDLKWFIENRDRLCRVSISRAFKCNTSNMIRDLNKKHDAKTLTRAFVFKNILNQFVSDSSISFYIPSAYEYRINALGMSEEQLIIERDYYIEWFTKMKENANEFKQLEDHSIMRDAEREILRLIKLRLV